MAIWPHARMLISATHRTHETADRPSDLAHCRARAGARRADARAYPRGARAGRAAGGCHRRRRRFAAKHRVEALAGALSRRARRAPALGERGHLLHRRPRADRVLPLSERSASLRACGGTAVERMDSSRRVGVHVTPEPLAEPAFTALLVR